MNARSQISESSSQLHEMEKQPLWHIDSSGWQTWYLLPRTAKFIYIDIKTNADIRERWKAVTGRARVLQEKVAPGSCFNEILVYLSWSKGELQRALEELIWEVSFLSFLAKDLQAFDSNVKMTWLECTYLFRLNKVSIQTLAVIRGECEYCIPSFEIPGCILTTFQHTVKTASCFKAFSDFGMVYMYCICLYFSFFQSY